MNSQHFNLARKWRPQNFDRIVGQDLSVRMLKNSLYRGRFFPVYLFSGQRGCGKTTTARVFAAAINCEQLEQFQKNPQKIVLPCTLCASCVAMRDGKHPDFIEMDAASHTGVDNVRQIIEASNLLPVMGKKKIYLIDEAHMLSKAAFNAFLKILEEPPSSVLFILATTDHQKIIDTVRSRSFQLFFSAIEGTTLREHLQTVCTQEQINYTPDGIELVIRETDGSARDALNLIEQVRFSSTGVSKDSVLKVLGHIGDEQLLGVLEMVLCGSAREALHSMREAQLHNYSAHFIWRRLVEFVRAAVWIKHGVNPRHLGIESKCLAQMVRRCTIARLREALAELVNAEIAFTRTTAQHMLLEVILLQLCRATDDDPGQGGASTPPQGPGEELYDEQDEDEEIEDEEGEDDVEDEEVDEEEDSLSFDARWQSFVQKVTELDDPLVSSVFVQGELQKADASLVQVAFAKQFIFFNDWIEQTRSLWEPVFKKTFGQNAALQPLFTREMPARSVEAPVRKAESVAAPQPQAAQKPAQAPVNKNARPYAQSPYKKKTQSQSRGAVETRVDISDTARWQKSHLLLKHFPGTVTEVSEQING